MRPASARRLCCAREPPVRRLWSVRPGAAEITLQLCATFNRHVIALLSDTLIRRRSEVQLFFRLDCVFIKNTIERCVVLRSAPTSANQAALCRRNDV